MKLLLGFAVTIAITFGSVPQTAAQSTVDFAVSGNSTIRGWTCEVTGTATLTTGGGDTAPGFETGVQAVVLTVPVAEFTCPNEEMTEHLMEAMRPDEHAEITFEMTSYDVTGQGAQASGSLTILDTTETVTVSLELTPTGAGADIEGEVRLDMTDYGVDPPTVMLGMLRVRPQITIEFSGSVSP